MNTRKMTIAALAGILGLSMVTAASAAPPDFEPPTEIPAMPAGIDEKSHDLPNPLAEQQARQKQQAREAVLNGKATPKGANEVVQVAKGQYVELANEDTDLIWTITGEFGELDSPFGVLQSGTPGPLHNEIPEPDRSVDNTTIWEPDFSTEYYEDLLFDTTPGVESMSNMYTEMSSGVYTVDGDVTDWVGVPYNMAHYGRDFCGGIVCSNVWWFVQDSANSWYASMLADGMTAEEIDQYLEQFDVWDRYDHDGDGDFDEPDGYIDHFQAVHAGLGQESLGAAASDYIWSHRWYVQLTPFGAGGPTTPDGTTTAYGGTQIGNSKYWIGDYTVEPENGGLGVFAHEYAHDLGLADYYDTSGNTCPADQPGCAENATGFWTLMSSGSNTGAGEDIGDEPTHMGAHEKFLLGWLDYEVAFAGDSGKYKLGPSMSQTKADQALIVVLPDREVASNLGSPYEGDGFYYSGAGNDLDNLMYVGVDLPADAELTAKAKVQIEADWDYAYLVVSDDGGATWTEIETNLSTNDNPNSQNFGFGITGDLGDDWVDLTADLSAYSGEVLVGFRYWTDVAAIEPGLSLDNIQITGQPVLGAEAGDPAITADPVEGWRVTDGAETEFVFNAYIAENRQYLGYDEHLQDGPYNFIDHTGTTYSDDLVEHFPYQDGLLVWYWNEQYPEDNNVSNHPGEGWVLPVDAHPEPLINGLGQPWRGRVQTYDATFGLEPTTPLDLHWAGEPSSHPSLPAVSVFDDSRSYWAGGDALAGVDVPNTGTVIEVKSVSNTGFMQIALNPKNTTGRGKR